MGDDLFMQYIVWFRLLLYHADRRLQKKVIIHCDQLNLLKQKINGAAQSQRNGYL